MNNPNSEHAPQIECDGNDETIKEFVRLLNGIPARPDTVRSIEEVKAAMEGIGEPHEPFSDYEPKEPTAEELKLAGVTILDESGSMLWLKCDVCNWIWGVGSPKTTRYWVCPQDLKRSALLGVTTV